MNSAETMRLRPHVFHQTLPAVPARRRPLGRLPFVGSIS
jgi:hypothetical protein